MVVVQVTTDNREYTRQYDNPVPWFGTAPEALLQGFADLSEVEVHVIGCTQRPMKSSPEKLAPNIWFHSLHVPKLGWMRTGYSGCIHAVRRKIHEIKPDIVHGQGTERECAISTVLSGYPNVVTVHGNMNAIAGLYHARIASFHWLAARLENFTLPRTGGIICISEYVQHLVTHFSVPFWIVPNAIQRMFFDFPQESPPPSKRPLLINVGVISERKRQQELLAVLESLRAEGLSFDTVFVGTIDPISAYGRQFETRLRAANERYGGFEHHRERLDNPAFCRLMDRASAMVHFSCEESFGLTFAEAIARGLFLFASDVGAAASIARGSENVRIFGPEEWTELKDAMRNWMADGGDKKPRPATPPPEFIKSFHPRHVALRHLEIYREVLSKRS